MEKIIVLRTLFKEMWIKELGLVSKLAKKRIAFNHIIRNTINIKTKKNVFNGLRKILGILKKKDHQPMIVCNI